MLDGMSLSSEDLAVIGQVMDTKLAGMRDQERRRRRFWIFSALALFVLVSLVSWLVMRNLIADFQRDLAAADARFIEAKLAYQSALARNQDMQAERRQAETTAGYVSGQDQASYEGQLIRGMLSMIGKSQDMNRRMAELDPDDLDGLVAATEELSGVTQGMLGMIGQMLLRNTDSAHNTIDENLTLGETGPDTTPTPVEIER